MKKKKLLIITLLCCTCAFYVFSFNPSVGGENLFQLGSPNTLADGNSVTGGALPYFNSANIATNPAIAASEQRVVVDISISTMISPNNGNGFAGYAGAIIPSKYGVFTGSLYGISSNLPTLDLGTCFTLRGGFSKDITEKLFVGADFSFSFGSALGANLGLGFIYNIGKIKWLPFLKDAKWGFSLTGIGYGFNPESSSTLYSGKTTASPSSFTPRIGVSGYLVDSENFDLGLALDFSFPTFQNAVIYPSLQALFVDIVRIKVGNELNIREMIENKASILPSVSVSVKFGINTKDDSFFAKQGWQQSEIVPAVAYKNLKGNIQVASVGITAHLGLKDTTPPEINLW